MIRLDRVAFEVGDFCLRDITLQVNAGEYFVLLGRPGSGKTLLLECVAGLRRVSGGTIEIGGRRVDSLGPADRHVGYLPQDYALFARRSVRGNIEFGVRMRGVGPAERDARVRQMADMLGITQLLSRQIAGLSGGERQRVALARALATEPQVLLLDEPVNALDPETRDEVLAELHRVQRETNTTAIHVCHDLDEMRAVADRVGILHEGALVQTGTPDEVAARPADATVARSLRLGTVLGGVALIESPGSRIELAGFSVSASGEHHGPVSVLIRASAVGLEDRESSDGLAATALSVLRRDATVQVELAVGATAFRAEVPRAVAASLELAPGREVRAVIPPEAVWVLGEA